MTIRICSHGCESYSAFQSLNDLHCGIPSSSLTSHRLSGVDRERPEIETTNNEAAGPLVRAPLAIDVGTGLLLVPLNSIDVVGVG